MLLDSMMLIRGYLLKLVNHVDQIFANLLYRRKLEAVYKNIHFRYVTVITKSV